MSRKREHKLRPDHLALLLERLQGYVDYFDEIVGSHPRTKGIRMDADTLILQTRDSEGCVSFFELNTRTGRLFPQGCRREVAACGNTGTRHVRSLPTQLDDVSLHRQLNQAIEDLLAESA